MIDKEQLLLDTLNLMIQSCEPIKYSEFNKQIKEKSKGVLEKIESENEKIGVGFSVQLNSDCITTLSIIATIVASKFKLETSVKLILLIASLSIIATITDCLIDKRLSFAVENDIILSVKWYE